MKQVVCALLLLFPLCSQAGDVMTASFPGDLKNVSVSLCFDGPAPNRLYRHELAGRYSTPLFHEGNQLGVSGNGASLRLPALPDNACLNWQTDFTTALNRKDYRLIIKRDEDLVMNTKLWFWKGPKHRDLVVDVVLPAGMSFSTPWKELTRSGSVIRFQPDRTSADWESQVAVGRFELDIIKVPGAEIRLAAPGSLSTAQKIKMRRWIEQTIEPVTAVYGYFPQPHPQVLAIPIGDRNEAVVKANVLRGGGIAAIFYVDETRPLEDYMAGWSTTHEFSHMLIPYVSSRDRWLSEGLASYYQNILRARDGRLTETEAWQELFEGFRRGKNGTHGGSLARATRQGRGSTMRVYWSGAALMLMADMQLREATNNQQSLDTALKSLASCCISNGKAWRAREMFERLDKLTGTSVFMGLYQEHVHSNNFPDMRPTWEYLGVEIRRNRVHLTASAPMASVRSAIMGPEYMAGNSTTMPSSLSKP